MKPEWVRAAKRLAVVAGAVGAVGGLAYGAASAVSKSEDAQRRLVTVESAERKLEGDLSRLEGKMDALLLYFRIPQPGRQP